MDPERRACASPGEMPAKRRAGHPRIVSEASPAQAGGAAPIGAGGDGHAHERRLIRIEQIDTDRAALERYRRAHNQRMIDHESRRQHPRPPYRTAIDHETPCFQTWIAEEEIGHAYAAEFEQAFGTVEHRREIFIVGDIGHRRAAELAAPRLIVRARQRRVVGAALA
ncbi:hypothetical protein KCU90_g630, partial [Aureobasidium melanogenum]